LVVAGGIIPDDDATDLLEQGVAAVFTPGAPLATITEWLESTLDSREADSGP
jgi:methylmalonyl-CoA mutase C-terminal domain/subunit